MLLEQFTAGLTFYSGPLGLKNCIIAFSWQEQSFSQLLVKESNLCAFMWSSLLHKCLQMSGLL